MSGGAEMAPAKRPVVPDNPALAKLSGLLDRLNHLILLVAMVAMIVTALVLTYSVVSRYFFNVATDWQDEASVFMLVGVTFFSAAYVQSYRGHIGIEALAGLLPRGVNRVRLILVDLLSLLFCGFFSWKSWTLFHEAFVEHQTTTSTLAPPLAIPYGIMAFGMSLLTFQLLVQLAARLTNHRDNHV